MKVAMITRIGLAVLVVLGLCGYGFEGRIVYAEDSNDTYIIVDDMEDYNDRDDIREVWRDGYPNRSSGSNLNVSTAVGSPYQGSTGPIYAGDQAMVLRYDNDGFTYTGLPGDEKIMYPVPYYSEIRADTVSLDVGRDWAAAGCTELSLWFQGHPVSDGAYDANEWPAYTLKGRGRDIGGRHDEFYFLGLYPLVSGGTIQVNVLGMDNTDPWAKAGVMIREKWTPYSKFAAVFITPGNGITFQFRYVEDGPVITITKPGVTAPQYIRLDRTGGDYFIAKHSDAGYDWQDVNAPGEAPVSPLIDMGTVEDPNIYIGTVVTSHNANQICNADFENLMVSPMPTRWAIGNIGTNDPERLYVALEDTVGNVGVVEHENVNAATMVTWQQWNIPLTAFTGVDFNSVEKVYIGLGDRENPVVGGSGTVYIDEIYASYSLGSYASNPIPADGAVIPGLPLADIIYTTLDFTAGEGAVSHEAFFSDDPAKVEARDPSVSLGPPPYSAFPTRYYVGMPIVEPYTDSLVRGVTYYWCVDETDDLGTTYPGDVWEFTIQDYKATLPNPADGAVIEDSDVLLSWFEGVEVTDHDVYMGTSWEDVYNAVYDPINPPPEYLGTVTEPSFMVTGLSENTTYYWRVDEVSYRMPFPIGGGTYYTGDVWSFTVLGTTVIQATVDVDPDILNLASQGKWITCYIELPGGYDVADIDPESILLEGEIVPQKYWLTDDEQIAGARFARSDAQAILEVGDVELTITGQLTDGTQFEAKDTIKVIDSQ
jgi:hypothetical protein